MQVLQPQHASILVWPNLRYASESRQIGFDPEISEWGNPAGRDASNSRLSKVGRVERTEGTETSKYLEEK